MTTSVQPLTAKLRDHDWSDWVGAAFFVTSAAVILARASEFSILLLPVIAHEVLVAISFLWRTKATSRPATWYARAIAYGASFSFPLLVTAAQTWRPQWLAASSNMYVRTAGGWIWIFGAVFGLGSLWSLRRSFSIEPEARILVIKGPYTVARHPIYASSILQYGGIVLIRPSITIATLFVLWLVLMVIRAHFEEQVLIAAFPEYEAYRRTVWMFCPKPLQRARGPEAAASATPDVSGVTGSASVAPGTPSDATAESCPTLTTS